MRAKPIGFLIVALLSLVALAAPSLTNSAVAATSYTVTFHGNV